MEEFEALRAEFVERGEKFVSDLIGQPVNFSDSAEAEELIGNYQQSVEDAINTAIANFTSGATTSSTEAAAPAEAAPAAPAAPAEAAPAAPAAPAEAAPAAPAAPAEAAPAAPAAAEQSVATQENLIATGVEQVFANSGNDSLTNPGQGSSNSDYQFNFEPAAEGFGGQVSFSLNGEATPLFTFGVGGTSSFGASGTSSFATGENPFATQFEEFIAGFASGDSLAGA